MNVSLAPPGTLPTTPQQPGDSYQVYPLQGIKRVQELQVSE
jgi:hypothetical protein